MKFSKFFSNLQEAPWYRAFLNPVIDQIGTEGKLLDIGTGSGKLIQILATEKGLDCVGVDTDSNMLTEAKEKLKNMMKRKFKTFDELYNEAPKELQQVIDKMEYSEQDPGWHPEGNSLVHAKIVYNRSLESNDIDLIMAAFFHDLGKATTTHKNKRGSWSAHGH